MYPSYRSIFVIAQSIICPSVTKKGFRNSLSSKTQLLLLDHRGYFLSLAKVLFVGRQKKKKQCSFSSLYYAQNIIHNLLMCYLKKLVKKLIISQCKSRWLLVALILLKIKEQACIIISLNYVLHFNIHLLIFSKSMHLVCI